MSAERRAEIEAWLAVALLKVPMPEAGEPLSGGAVRHMLAVEQVRRQARLGKAQLRLRALRVCGLAACDVLLVKGPNESWHDYLHRTTCCRAHRNQYRPDFQARAQAQARHDEEPR